MQRTDFIAVGEEAEHAVVPALKNRLMLQASQLILRSDTGLPSIVAPPLSATGIPERIRDRMWWKRYTLTHEQAWGTQPAPSPKKQRRAR